MRQRLPLAPQLARFVAVGVLSAGVDFGLLVTGMGFGLQHNAAKSLSFVAGTATAYALNRRWTFAAPASRRRFLAVLALYALTFGIQVGIFALVYSPLEAATSRLVAQVAGFVLAQGAATTLNFVLQRRVIFAVRSA